MRDFNGNKLRIGLSSEQENKVLDIAQKMFGGAKKIREDYESDWRELAKYFMPHMLRLDDTTSTRKSKWSNIINNTCRTSVRTLQAGMQSGLTSPARPWFRLGLEDFELMDYQPAKLWLDQTTKRMQTIFRRSNFYNTAHSMYGVLSVFGTAGQTQMFDFQDVMRFRGLMTGRYWIAQNHRGVVDTLFTETWMTVQQMVEMFGDRVDPATRREYDNGEYFNKKKVMCGIFKNPFPKWSQSGQAIIAANQKPFVSVYWIEGHQTPLKTSGFNRFPAQVPRWDRTDDEPWGIGVGVDAIGDTKAIQLKEREKAKGLQKMINPPVSAPAEMRHAQFPISGLPGGVTYRPNTVQADSVRTLYDVNLPLQYLQQDITIDEGRVEKAFYADLFLMLANMERRDMTATEIAERHEEKLLALGPVVESLGHEFLDPNIERAFEIMMEQTLQGNNPLIPPPPEEIQNTPMKVEYISVLAQAQQQVGIGSIDRYLQFTGATAQMFPEARYKVNALELVDEMGDMLGVPSRVTRSNDEAMAMHQADMQQAQQAAAMEQAASMAQTAKTMSEVQVGDGNALDQVM